MKIISLKHESPIFQKPLFLILFGFGGLDPPVDVNGFLKIACLPCHADSETSRCKHPMIIFRLSGESILQNAIQFFCRLI